MSECVICSGAKKIRLPVRRRMSTSVSGYDEMAPGEDAVRTYACPECSPVADDNRVLIVGGAVSVSTHHDVPKNVIHEDIAREIAFEMLERGLIRFRSGHEDTKQLRQEHIGTIGVVSTVSVKTIEQRTREHQERIARDVIEKAAGAIDHYGSAFSHTGVPKSVAIECMRDALKNVINDNTE